MTEARLIARKLNHGRTEVHLEAGGHLASESRDVATNLVLGRHETLRCRHCGKLEAFLMPFHTFELAAFDCEDSDGVGVELRLKRL